jgi:carbon monoxide dehydrogenase subunit G
VKLEQSFQVAAPIEEVWLALNDLERVAPCLPGATITGHDDAGTYKGEFTVKLGPTTAAYRGTIRITERDDEAHRATMVAKGNDKRGQGGASATIVNVLSEHDGGTRVDSMTDFSITGRLARFGRGGMIEDVSSKLLRDFSACLATRLGESDPPTGADITRGDAAPEEAAG